MSARFNVRNLPPRLATGAYILNSGVTKLSTDEPTAAMLHGMATNTYPFLAKVGPARFVRLLAVTEIAVGSALLLPAVPRLAAGAALTGFSAALLGLYVRTPGMRGPDGVRPTQEGVPLAKDVWMLGIGSGLVLDGLLSRRERRRPPAPVAA